MNVKIFVKNIQLQAYLPHFQNKISSKKGESIMQKSVGARGTENSGNSQETSTFHLEKRKISQPAITLSYFYAYKPHHQLDKCCSAQKSHPPMHLYLYASIKKCNPPPPPRSFRRLSAHSDRQFFIRTPRHGN